jgi:hypothetical protein
MGENKPAGEARYIHSAYGQGFSLSMAGTTPKITAIMWVIRRQNCNYTPTHRVSG